MSFSAIVRVYIKKYRHFSVDELNFYHEQSSLRSAIELAAFAINPEGKRHAHQWRIRHTALNKAQILLQDNIDSIERVKDFDELIHLIEGILDSVSGIGELYIYDTSLRIGAWLHQFPEKVYLHAGTREGARALGISGRAKAIEPGSLPIEFQELKPYEIEDVLCIFKDILKKEKVINQGQLLMNREIKG
jgi:hypothetical protein